MTLTMGIEKNIFRPASIDFAKLESLPVCLWHIQESWGCALMWLAQEASEDTHLRLLHVIRTAGILF